MSALVSHVLVVYYVLILLMMLPIMKSISSFTNLLIEITILGIILTCTKHFTDTNVLLLIPTFRFLLLATIKLVLLLSVLATYLRNVVQMLPTLLAIKFFTTPLLYSPDDATPLIRSAIE